MAYKIYTLRALLLILIMPFMVIFSIFIADVILTRIAFTKSEIIELTRRGRGKFNISPVLQIVPVSCIPDRIFYKFLDCKNKNRDIFELLSSKNAVSVLSYSDDKAYYGDYSNRVIYKYSDLGYIYPKKIDLHGIDNNIPDNFECSLELIKSSFVMRLPIYIEICKYKEKFVYSVVAIKSIYGIPYNPIGESLLPIRVVDWREFGTGRYDELDGSE